MYYINDDIQKARELFGIEEFPGNLFEIFLDEKRLENNQLIIFKEDLDKLSGFIGYGEDHLAVICVNYNRPIGHQNFTLAHEIGHWILHRGESIADDDSVLYSKNAKEMQANDFASELLYPTELFEKDFERYSEVVKEEDYKRLSDYINEICHKYCLSYDMVCRRVWHSSSLRYDYKYSKFKRTLEHVRGGKISKIYDSDFYTVNNDLPEYQQSRQPYEMLRRKIDKALELQEIGTATAESIKYKYGIKD